MLCCRCDGLEPLPFRSRKSFRCTIIRVQRNPWRSFWMGKDGFYNTIVARSMTGPHCTERPFSWGKDVFDNNFVESLGRGPRGLFC